MQLEAGAVGITCAKVSEAEAMAEGGMTDIFVAYPLVTERKARRLAALARRGVTVSTIVDSPEGVAALSNVFKDEPAPLDVLVKVDAGLGRIGTAPGADTVALAQRIAAAPGPALRRYLHPRGAIVSPSRSGGTGGSIAGGGAGACHDGTRPGSGGAAARTGECRFHARRPGGGEHRRSDGDAPGNYAFYDAMQVGLNVVPPARCALRVLVTVVSHTARDRAVIERARRR